MSALPKSVLSLRDYLTTERADERKTEFFDCEMFVMAGTTKHHARIVMNPSRGLSTSLKGQTNGLYTYPDLLDTLLLEVPTDPTAFLHMPSIDCEIPVADNHEGVEFPLEPAPSAMEKPGSALG